VSEHSRWPTHPPSFFEDARRFPPGAAQPACALLMRSMPVTWHALAPPARAA
jgi:hypothetical protein